MANPTPAVVCGLGTHLAAGECVPDGAPSPIDTATTSWSANVQVSEDSLDFATETAMAVDSRGNIAIAAIIFPHYDPVNFNAGIAVWLSRDHGQSFARAYTATAPTGTFLGDPTLLYDQDDHLIVGWIAYSSSDFLADVMIARSSDGAKFSDPELVDPAGNQALRDRPWLSLGPSGFVTLSWAAFFFGNGDGGMKRSDSFQGSTFDVVETIEPSKQFDFIDGPIAFAPSGVGVGIGESLTAYRRTAAGWTPVIAFPLSSPDVEPAPQIAWSPNAGFVVVFLGPPRAANALYAMRSLDEGRSWSAPRPIAGGAVGKSAAALPWLAADEKGRMHAMWLDDKGGGWAPYTAMSEDGIHFRAAERIGDATFVDNGDPRRWLGDFDTFVATGGRRYATWADSRKDGRSAIYFSSAPEVP